MGSCDLDRQVLTCCSFLYQCGIAHNLVRCRSVSAKHNVPSSTQANFARMILPFPVLVKSQIQKRKKFALLGLLTLGTFITIIQVVRIQTVKNLANYLDSSKLIMWSTVENNLGIIVASIPTLAPLFKYYAEKTQKSSTAKSASQSRSRSLYALKSLRSTRQESLPLGSGVDHVTHIGRGGRSDGESAELILGDVGAITKKIEVTISRSLSRGMEGNDGAR
jgi:hypothetical protein